MRPERLQNRCQLWVTIRAGRPSERRGVHLGIALRVIAWPIATHRRFRIGRVPGMLTLVLQTSRPRILQWALTFACIRFEREPAPMPAPSRVEAELAALAPHLNQAFVTTGALHQAARLASKCAAALACRKPRPNPPLDNRV